jgi:hypothetical protein
MHQKQQICRNAFLIAKRQISTLTKIPHFIKKKSKETKKTAHGLRFSTKTNN